ncbi:type IV secretory system conjugative DNA transfer family protein [Promicromonospora thailandica]|uniref:AAA-like domain-containing protein n=1 Tax=Promicromonospora thailandica TaxID=765201 RepID=A0A9X2G061_9MICO|nr:type IV secretory system conjugative DNA transfer family protein [Promicromonospora thailandica]MCP2264622.1 AAA-like domain-containing protein [Promicromonospora thailandica]BFF20308.1 type IV secretory system conjugative DNA transfer family protein [Promicromonospora thailandica]
MTNPTEFVFSQLHLPRPLDPPQIGAFLTRIASERDAPRVALELRADSSGVQHLLGCRPTDVHRLRRLLADLIPGSLLTKLKGGGQHGRPDVEMAARLRLKPGGLPLRTDAPEATTRSLLSAMAAKLKLGEVAVLQVVLGPHHAPRPVPRGAVEPGMTLAQALTGGNRPAAPETKLRLRERLSQAGFVVTIRIGAASPDRGRRRRLIMNLLGALSTAQSPGVRLDLVRQPAKQLNDVRLPWRWPLHLGVTELIGLLGWPIGGDDLPGLPPAHPKPLRPAAAVHTSPRVFATSAAPGDDRQVGISPADQTFHAVAYGPSGSGKTNTLLHLILADIKAGRPVAVLDPKKQLVDDILARMPKERIKDVVILDAADPTVGFNPLDVAGRDPDVVVDGILAVFEAVFSDGWGPRTADIFSAALRTLARASTPDRSATLIDLPRLLTDSRFRRQQTAQVQDDLALGGFWAWYEAQSPRSQAAAIAAPLNKLRQLLLRPAVVRMLDQRSGKFRLRNLFREDKIVLMPLNEGLVGTGTAGLLGSLAVAEIWQATQERAEEKDPAKRPGMVVVDEAPRFLHLPTSLADALAVSRSLGVGWFLAAQFRSQFPPALRSAVDMNARSKIVFSTEYEDARDTAKLASNLTPEDFMALPKYHAYANLVALGHPSGWALIKTLPPPPAITDSDEVRAASRAGYGATSPEAEPTAEPAKPDRPKRRSVAASPPVVAEQVGRKRRQP